MSQSNLHLFYSLSGGVDIYWTKARQISMNYLICNEFREMGVCRKCWDPSLEMFKGYGNCRVSHKALNGIWEAAKAQLNRSLLVSSNQYLPSTQVSPSSTRGCSQAVKQHTGQDLCLGISSILYHQKSEWSLTFHPGFTGSSITDLTGTSGCSARERLLLCEGATQEALYGILNSMLWWVLTINKAQ